MRKEVFGGWVELRDPDLVPERLRRPVFELSAKGAALTKLEENEVSSDVIAFFSQFNDLVVIAMVKEWSFEAQITLDGLLDLPAKSYDAIRNLVSPYLSELIPDFGVNIDPKATTENLNESVG